MRYFLAGCLLALLVGCGNVEGSGTLNAHGCPNNVYAVSCMAMRTSSNCAGAPAMIQIDNDTYSGQTLVINEANLPDAACYYTFPAVPVGNGCTEEYACSWTP